MKQKRWQQRFGNPVDQDWYAALVEAVRIFSESDPTDTQIFVVSENSLDGKPEVDEYLGVLNQLGVPSENIMVLKEGRETVGQMESVMKFCRPMEDTAIFICSYLHWTRVRWVADDFSSKNVEVKATGGWLRPWEAFTDLILAVAFPIIDTFGMRGGFFKKPSTVDRKAFSSLWQHSGPRDDVARAFLIKIAWYQKSPRKATFGKQGYI